VHETDAVFINKQGSHCHFWCW